MSLVKNTVPRETHIQYIAYISFTLIFFPHQTIFSESQINSLSNDIKYLLVFFPGNKKCAPNIFYIVPLKRS